MPECFDLGYLFLILKRDFLETNSSHQTVGQAAIIPHCLFFSAGMRSSDTFPPRKKRHCHLMPSPSEGKLGTWQCVQMVENGVDQEGRKWVWRCLLMGADVTSSGQRHGSCSFDPCHCFLDSVHTFDGEDVARVEKPLVVVWLVWPLEVKERCEGQQTL